MKIGITLPQTGSQATRDNLIRAAERAEEIGYDSLWTLERILWPTSPREPYPASFDGKLPEAFQIVFDPIETLTFVAAHTSRVRLGTSIIVLPYHTPVELARRVATLDQLSFGRLDLGVGIGWSSDEFVAAGTAFERRGQRSDEFLRAMFDIWTKDPVSFKGEFYHIPESMIGPKPVQEPHPPILVAGEGRHAHRRAVRFGAGWNPSGIRSFEALEEEIKQFHQAAAEAGRGEMRVVLRTIAMVTDRPPARMPMIGSLDEIARDIRRLGSIGVTELILTPPEIGFIPTSEIEPGLRRMEQLIEISR